MSNDPAEEHIEALRDTANRLERSIDIQHEIISGIDQKAEHITRLLGVVLGLVFSILSIIIQPNTIQLQEPALTTIVAFAIGILFLMASMTAAIITYLSSKYKIGLEPAVGDLFAETEFETTLSDHFRATTGAYAYNIRQNRLVIEENSHRFRFTLFSLLAGVISLSVSGSLYIGRPSDRVGKLMIIVILAATGVLAWYILRGKYLTFSGDENQHEQIR